MQPNFGRAQNILGPVKGQGISMSLTIITKKEIFRSLFNEVRADTYFWQILFY